MLAMIVIANTLSIGVFTKTRTQPPGRDRHDIAAALVARDSANAFMTASVETMQPTATRSVTPIAGTVNRASRFCVFSGKDGDVYAMRLAVRSESRPHLLPWSRPVRPRESVITPRAPYSAHGAHRARHPYTETPHRQHTVQDIHTETPCKDTQQDIHTPVASGLTSRRARTPGHGTRPRYKISIYWRRPDCFLDVRGHPAASLISRQARDTVPCPLRTRSSFSPGEPRCPAARDARSFTKARWVSIIASPAAYAAHSCAAKMPIATKTTTIARSGSASGWRNWPASSAWRSGAFVR